MKLTPSRFIQLFLLGCLMVTTAVCAREPLDTMCIDIQGKKFTVEIAMTPNQREVGLQGRDHLGIRRGMIFPFDEAQYLTFWMKDCKIPLDILFFHKGVLVDYVDKAPPCNKQVSECPLYKSRALADTVVELRAGSRIKYNLQPMSHLSACP